MSLSGISDRAFGQFQAMIHEIAGISMSPAKKTLVSGRLAKRVRHHDLDDFDDYFRLLMNNGGELQIAVDLLTTNETYFFREPKHFDFLRAEILPEAQRAGNFRVWSAACSSGEEPYSIAMLLASTLGETGWDITASDISSRVLERARSGHYALERSENIPRDYLAAHCLKGIGEHEGTFLINRKLRERIKFIHVNLNNSLPKLGEFDVIFLRNVMIYFDIETKRQVVNRLLPLLKRGGYLLVSHSESLNGVCDTVRQIKPSIYRKD